MNNLVTSVINKLYKYYTSRKLDLCVSMLSDQSTTRLYVSPNF